MHQRHQHVHRDGPAHAPAQPSVRAPAQTPRPRLSRAPNAIEVPPAERRWSGDPWPDRTVIWAPWNTMCVHEGVVVQL